MCFNRRWGKTTFRKVHQSASRENSRLLDKTMFHYATGMEATEAVGINTR
jgi:hypothetical protein